MHAPIILLLGLLWSFPLFSGPEDLAFDESRWEKTGESDGISLFKQRIPSSNIFAVRGEGVIAAEVWELASIVLEAGRAKEWMDDIEESWVVERKSPTHYISYSHVGTPFMVKDRDFVMAVEIQWEPAFSTFEMFYQPDTTGAGPVTDYVRGAVQGSFRLRKVKEGTHLIAEVHADPKGNVPVWVVNMFQKSWAKKTFAGLREQVRSGKIRAPEKFRDLFLKVPASLRDLAGKK